MSSSINSVKATVAILGGTGDVGLRISRVFLSEYRSQFPNVRIITRNTSSSKSQELAKLGAQLYTFTQPLDEVLSGVDVVVDALPTRTVSEEYSDELLAAMVRHNVKVYFPSEFGADYDLNEFDGYEHAEWPYKRVQTAKIHAALEGKTKVVNVITGMFLGWFFLPGLGIDVEKNVYTPLGPGSLRIATTAESDIGRSVAQLAVLALDPATAATVPTKVRVSGQNPSFEDIRDAVSRVKGVPKGEIRSEDLAAFNERLRASPSDNVLDYIRVLVGQKKFAWPVDNQNELVNPGECLWKWKTIEDQLRGQA